MVPQALHTEAVDPEQFDNAIVEAVALLVGHMGGALKLPVHRAVPDELLVELNQLFLPAHVNVKRGVWASPAIFHLTTATVGDALIFEPLPSVLP